VIHVVAVRRQARLTSGRAEIDDRILRSGYRLQPRPFPHPAGVLLPRPVPPPVPTVLDARVSPHIAPNPCRAARSRPARDPAGHFLDRRGSVVAMNLDGLGGERRPPIGRTAGISRAPSARRSWPRPIRAASTRASRAGGACRRCLAACRS
jgi:hypothetical protein